MDPSQQCDLTLSDHGWQRREPFKDSNCGEQTLDALCRAPPAGLGTASTLLAPVLPWSIEAFYEQEQAGGEEEFKRRDVLSAFPFDFALPLKHFTLCLFYLLPLCFNKLR